jgi:hypothetical protein
VVRKSQDADPRLFGRGSRRKERGDGEDRDHSQQ